MEILKLIGVVIVVLGFAFKKDTIATVVVVLVVTAPASSMPSDRSVIGASVVSGVISEMASTNVVLPAANPPATTIFNGFARNVCDVGVIASDVGEVIEEPF